MDNLWDSADVIPEKFRVVFETLNNLNLNNSIHIDNDEINEFFDDDNDTSVVREVSFKLVKLANGTLKLEMNFSDTNNSISLNAELSPGDREIQRLHVSGIQPSTLLNDEWD